MSIYTGVTSCSCKILIVFERDVESSSRVSVLLRETKINNIDFICSFAKTNKKIVGFDVSMDKIFGMSILDSSNLYTEGTL